jgi:hypothetical protein
MPAGKRPQNQLKILQFALNDDCHTFARFKNEVKKTTNLS